MDMTQFPLFSHRSDAAVPAFDDAGVICVMDAMCGVCARGAKWIARRDRAEEVRIVPMQSPLGAALLRHYGMDAADPTSWLLLEGGRAYGSADAVMRMGARLGGAARLLGVFRVLPRGLRDWLYQRLARNRYRLARRVDLCAMPDADVQKRLMR
ncbi:DUF393 domain-containing protein [Alphaproteobacteria bacterium KMM 3653]|uniref:DUF393 domain-containing protein n=1 Tax=Harenicola maris TaxID=2841044 RepID=A0AAP2CKN3_9RHOB|nr:DUF393 domain-containing protein [Harenicola maris]